MRNISDVEKLLNNRSVGLWKDIWWVWWCCRWWRIGCSSRIPQDYSWWLGWVFEFLDGLRFGPTPAPQQQVSGYIVVVVWFCCCLSLGVLWWCYFPLLAWCYVFLVFWGPESGFSCIYSKTFSLIDSKLSLTRVKLQASVYLLCRWTRAIIISTDNYF